MLALQGQATNRHVGTAPVLAVLWRRSILERVRPLVAPVAEGGKKSADRDIGAFPELVVGARRRAPAGAVVDVVANVHRVVIGFRASIRIRLRIGLDVVDAAAVIVIGSAYKQSNFLGFAKALADSAAHLVHRAAANDRRVSADPVKSGCRHFARSLGYKVYG